VKQQKILPSKKIKNKGNNDADENAGRQRKIKTEAFPLDRYVSRKMPQPGQFARERKHRADDNQHNADQDQCLTQSRHGRSLHSL
jgi:hypothetical protein